MIICNYTNAQRRKKNNELNDTPFADRTCPFLARARRSHENNATRETTRSSFIQPEEK